MLGWVLGTVALVVALLAVRDLARRKVPVDAVAHEAVTHEPGWEDRYGHHARQAQGWTLQSRGGH